MTNFTFERVSQMSSDVNNSAMHHVEDHSKISTVAESTYPNKRGRINYQGSWWFALCIDNVVTPVGSTVQVTGFKNITCIVKPLPVAQCELLLLRGDRNGSYKLFW